MVVANLRLSPYALSARLAGFITGSGAAGERAAMRPRFFRWARRTAAALIASLALAAQAQGQTILRDSETELLFRDISRPIVAASGLNPDNVKIVLVKDDEINAFVVQGQVVYIHSGLLTSADNVNQLQGVIAHEIGHIVGGHAIRLNDGMNKASTVSLASMLLGLAAGVAGAGEAAMGVMALGQSVAMANLLSFTRAQESSADQAGVTYLAKAGISGKGSLEFFRKLQNQEYRLAIYATDSYNRTHPLSSERVRSLEDLYRRDPAWNRPADAQLEARFQRVKGKLLGYLDPKRAVTAYPESDKSPGAHYARALAYHSGAYAGKANAEANALLAMAPRDPFYLELKGQVLLEGGQPAKALQPLRDAVSIAPDQPMIAAMLGHALVATENKANYAEAKTVLKAAVSRDNDNPDAWLSLGMVYEHEGDLPRAALATAERMNLHGEPQRALTAAKQAMAGLPAGSADYLRAQDIAMVSEAEIKKDKKKGRRDD